MSHSPERFVNESELKTVDKLSKYTVFGYIQRIQKEINNELFNVIPKLIICVILAFYTDIIDEFEIMPNHITLKDDNKTVYSNANAWCTCYGKKIISSIINGTYIWKIKLYSPQNNINIGIDSYDDKSWVFNNALYLKKSKACYLFSNWYGFLYRWDESERKTEYPLFTNKNDILTMKLMFTPDGNGKISYKINDNDEFIGFENITREKSLNYRFVASFYYKNTSLGFIE